MAARRYGQQSAVVRALELVGERWALLIVRDLLVGPRRYTDLKQNLPRIPTNILSDRLKELQHADVIRRLPLAHGLAYALTEHGRDLEPVILGLARWGLRSLGEPAHGDLPTPDSLTVDLLAAGDTDAASRLGTAVYDLQVTGFVLTIQVAGDELTVRPGPSEHATVVIGCGPDLRALFGGATSGTALQSNAPTGTARTGPALTVLAGDPALLGPFCETFAAGRVLPAPA